MRGALADNLGSVRDLATYNAATHTTTIDVHYVFDAFGRIVSGDASQTRYLYTGQEFEIQVGLVDYNARFYDPRVGQFVSPDFIHDNLNNTYAYVGNGLVALAKHSLGATGFPVLFGPSLAAGGGGAVGARVDTGGGGRRRRENGRRARTSFGD